MLKDERCPFCGHDNCLELRHVDDIVRDGDVVVAHVYHIACNYCEASGPMALNEQKAYNAWKGSLKNKGVTIEGAIPCCICGGLPMVQRHVQGDAGEPIKVTKVWCPACQHIVSETWGDIDALGTEGSYKGGFYTEKHIDFLLKRVVDRWNEANRD